MLTIFFTLSSLFALSNLTTAIAMEETAPQSVPSSKQPWGPSHVSPIIPQLVLSQETKMALQLKETNLKNNPKALFHLLQDSHLIVSTAKYEKDAVVLNRSQPQKIAGLINIKEIRQAVGSFTDVLFEVDIPKNLSAKGKPESLIVKGVKFFLEKGKDVRFRGQQTPDTELQGLEYLLHSNIKSLPFEEDPNLPRLSLPIRNFWYYIPVKSIKAEHFKGKTTAEEKILQRSFQHYEDLIAKRGKLNDDEYESSSDGEYESSSDGEYESSSDGEYESSSDGEYESSSDGEYESSSDEGEDLENIRKEKIKAIKSGKLEKYYVTILERAHGKDLTDIMKTEGYQNTGKLKVVFRKVGRAIGEIHYRLARPGEKAKVAKGDFGHFLTTAHYDFHPGNIFFDENSNKAEFIDLATMAATHRKNVPFWHDLLRFYYMSKYVTWFTMGGELNAFNDVMRSFIKGYVEAYPQTVQSSLKRYLEILVSQWTQTIFDIRELFNQGKLAQRIPQYKIENPAFEYEPDIYAVKILVRGGVMYHLNKKVKNPQDDDFFPAPTPRAALTPAKRGQRTTKDVMEAGEGMAEAMKGMAEELKGK